MESVLDQGTLTSVKVPGLAGAYAVAITKQEHRMTIEKHDLLHEFPEHRDTIHQLKMANAHFSRLFTEYHELDHEVHRIENGVEPTSDDYLEERKKQRLHLKDQLYKMIQEAN